MRLVTSIDFLRCQFDENIHDNVFFTFDARLTTSADCRVDLKMCFTSLITSGWLIKRQWFRLWKFLSHCWINELMEINFLGARWATLDFKAINCSELFQKWKLRVLNFNEQKCLNKSWAYDTQTGFWLCWIFVFLKLILPVSLCCCWCTQWQQMRCRLHPDPVSLCSAYWWVLWPLGIRHVCRLMLGFQQSKLHNQPDVAWILILENLHRQISITKVNATNHNLYELTVSWLLKWFKALHKQETPTITPT